MTTIHFTLLSLHISSLLVIIHETIVLFGGGRRIGGMGNGGDGEWCYRGELGEGC